MDKNKKWLLTALMGLLLLLTSVRGVYARANMENMITSGGIYHLSPLSRGTAANPTITTGNGRFWVSWPRADRIEANHSNPTWEHRSTACNASTCVRSHGERGWRQPSATGHASIWVFASARGNSGHWAINPCNQSGCH